MVSYKLSRLVFNRENCSPAKFGSNGDAIVLSNQTINLSPYSSWRAFKARITLLWESGSYVEGPKAVVST